VKLAYRLLLIAGHTLGDLALPLMKRQCDNLETTMDTLTPAQAEKLLPALERVLGAYMARPADLKQVMHELRLEVGAERFSRGELQPRGVEGRSNPGARSAVSGATSTDEHARTDAREERNGGSADPRKG
jgi:hypothetical protein